MSVNAEKGKEFVGHLPALKCTLFQYEKSQPGGGDKQVRKFEHYLFTSEDSSARKNPKRHFFPLPGNVT